jgi:hypothetical protein
MANNDDKANLAQIDIIDEVSPSNHGVLSGNEAMVYQLETTGEEVGMTWRSLLAAGVCPPSHRYRRC